MPCNWQLASSDTKTVLTSPASSLPMNIQLFRLCKALHNRRNWLFLGNDDAGDVNAAFVSLLASCGLHQIEPWAYLRDLLCLLPSWPSQRVLELAPVNWHKTLEGSDTQQQLAANVFRRFTLDRPLVHCRSK